MLCVTGGPAVQYSPAIYIQGDKEDREKMRAMDADKVRQEKAQRMADDALMEPARLAARGLSLEQIITEMKRQGLPVEREYLQRQIEKASRKRLSEEEEPFFAVNKDVSNVLQSTSCRSCFFTLEAW